MNFLEERIARDGIVKEGNVLKVDSFLNHQMDIELFEQMGAEVDWNDETKTATVSQNGTSITFAINEADADINGQTVQQGCTEDMLFSVDKIIAYVSRFFTLKIGDLIYTGTPAGIGAVHIGDHLEGYLGDRKLLDFHVR